MKIFESSLFIYISLIWFFYAPSCYADDGTIANRQKFIEMAQLAVQKANESLQKNNFPLMASFSKEAQVRLRPDRLRKNEVIEVGDSQSPAWIKILQNGESITFFLRNDKASTVLYDLPQTPKWSPDQAVLMAKEFVSAVIGHFPEEVAKPLVKMEASPVLKREESRKYTQKHPDVTWRVIWPRVDSDGHPFGKDSINVQLNERTGLIAIGFNFFSNYVPPHKIILAQVDAQKAAVAYAKQIMEWGPAQARFVGYKLSDSLGAEMWIVNPNNITMQQSYEDLGTAHDLNARLAWIVKFKALQTGSREGTEATGAGEISVWIDAENGKFLGGDFN